MHITTGNRLEAMGDLVRAVSIPAPNLPNDLTMELSTGKFVAFSPGDITTFLTAIRDTTNPKIREILNVWARAAVIGAAEPAEMH
jgi:hypothetical protein